MIGFETDAVQSPYERVTTRTPFRVSFFGGGTDYPVYYREHGGAVLSTSIDKYCYITCRQLPPLFDHRYRIQYSRREETQTIDAIEHPAVRACLKYMTVTHGFEMVHTSDIPARSGIGSSSAFTVGLLHALYAMQGRRVSKGKLARTALHVEQDLIGEAVGSQDQIATALGGLNFIEFPADGRPRVQPLRPSREHAEQLQASLLFVFTGYCRCAATIAEEQIKQTPAKLSSLHQMRAMVDEARTILTGPLRHLDDFGRLLHESWQLKRALTDKISTPHIDDIYQRARAAGALGGKLCGAGGGGFLLLYAPADTAQRVRQALAELTFVPIRFEQQGSQLIYRSAEPTTVSDPRKDRALPLAI